METDWKSIRLADKNGIQIFIAIHLGSYYLNHRKPVILTYYLII